MHNDCRVLHETIVKDVIDLFDTIRDTDIEDIIEKRNRSPYSKTSLAKLTDNLVCVFPVMVSSSLSIDSATMIMKAIERKAAVMLQLLFSAYQVQNADNIVDVLSKFHRNIKLNDKIGVDDVIAVMDKISESVGMKVDYNQVKAIREDMRNINFYFEKSVNPTSLNDISISRNPVSREIHIEGAGGDRRLDKDYPRAAKMSDMSKAFSANDIKKANELMPTTLLVNFVYKPPAEGSRPVPIEGVAIGVKARLIPVSSNDITNHIISKVEDKNWLLQLIRATTRETSFVKDFLLAIDKAKIDALAHSRQGSANPMWKVLERRAMGSRLKRLLGSNNAYMAITTLCVSQEDVDYVKKEFNIDFEQPSNIDPLFSNLNLMCVCIVDEALEVAKFMFDTGDGNWENYSFSSLEREDKDNTYKKVVNLMTKVAR